VAKELGLSDDQVKKLTAERDAFKDEMQATRQDMRDLMDAQRTLLASEKVDQAAFKTNVEKMASLKAEHVRKMGDHMLVVRDILSAEQFAKLHEMRPMGGKMHGDGMGMGHDCSGCPAAN
jgi:Spy/CpxP family protein refolding chaperone